MAGDGQGVQEVLEPTPVAIEVHVKRSHLSFYLQGVVVVGSSSASATASGGSTSSPPSPSSPLSSGSAVAAPSGLGFNGVENDLQQHFKTCPNYQNILKISTNIYVIVADLCHLRAVESQPCCGDDDDDD